MFSKSENKEFEFIWNSFNKIIPLEFEVSVYDIGTGRIEKKNAVVYSFTLHLATLVASLTNIFTLEYQRKLVQSSLVKDALELVGIDSQNPDQYVRTIEFPDLSEFTDELLMHGLIEKFTITSLIDGSEYLEHTFELSKKYFRFRFWLAYQQKLPERELIEIVKDSN